GLTITALDACGTDVHSLGFWMRRPPLLFRNGRSLRCPFRDSNAPPNIRSVSSYIRTVSFSAVEALAAPIALDSWDRSFEIAPLLLFMFMCCSGSPLQNLSCVSSSSVDQRQRKVSILLQPAS